MPSSTYSSFGRRAARLPCVHALLLKSMCTRQTRTSPTRTTEVEVGLDVDVTDLMDFADLKGNGPQSAF